MRPLARVTALGAALSMTLAMTGPIDGEQLVEAVTDAAHDSTVLVGLEADGDLAVLDAFGDVANVLEQIDVAVLEVAPGTVEATIGAVTTLPGVAFAEPNFELGLHGEPNDPLLGQQYQLDRIKALAGFEAYNEAVDAEPFAAGGGAKLAILDSGIDLLHPELGPKVEVCASFLTATGTGVNGLCQDNNFHGTYVAGIAGAITDNAEGIAGVGFDADLMVYQVCTLVCFTADSAAAMIAAADAGAEVANYSFGGASPSETSRRAVEHADRAGVLQIASAGNSGQAEEGDSTVGFPAAFPQVVAVGATDRDDRTASFSSSGPEVEVTAPGVTILSTMPGRSYSDRFSGTSFSGPAVAGLGALLVNLGLDRDEARAAIVNGADQGAVVDYDPLEHGAGMADVAASIASATGGGDGGGGSDARPGNRGGNGGGNGGGPPEGRGPNR